MCVCLWTYHTHIAAGLDCFYSQVLVCRSHSKRGNEAEIKRKKANKPSRQRETLAETEGEKEVWRCLSGGSPSSVSPLTLYPLPCTPSTPPVFLSQQLSADCLGFLVPIRPITLCFHQTQHLSYHCLDNCLLVQKSLRALCSHGDDIVTLPGSSEPPAEIVGPFPLFLSPCSSLFAHPFASLLLLLWQHLPPPHSLQLFESVARANTHIYAQQMGYSPAQCVFLPVSIASLHVYHSV